MAVRDKDTVLNNNLIDLIARLHDRFHFLPPFVLMAERQRQARFSNDEHVLALKLCNGKWSLECGVALCGD
jgi:hypothetical protein